MLDNYELIQTLEETKNKSIEITEAIRIGEETSQEIDIARNSYNPAAKRGSILFFAMTGLCQISQMYQFSLSSYLSVFNLSLREARKDTILENRLRNIIDKLTVNIYDYTCLGVFEAHKLMFSFQMTIQILDGEGLIDKHELDFFLKGNTNLEDVEDPIPQPWIPIAGWKDLQNLVTVCDVFRSLISDLKENLSQFKVWYDQEKPENEELPLQYNKITTFQ